MNTRVRALLVGAVLFAASVASATISPTILHVEASNSLGSTTLDIPASDLVPDPSTGGYKWILPAAQDLYPAADPTNIIATLNAATIRLVDNPLGVPRILVNFELVAGDQNAQFFVAGPEVSFATMPAAQARARATAGFTLTDYNDGVPALLQGLNPPIGLGMFSAKYNGAAPGGTLFTNLIEELMTDSGGSVSATDAYPAAGFSYLGVPVSSISVMYGFTLTAHDLMSGQDNYFVTPEPASLGCVVLGGLALVLRRR